MVSTWTPEQRSRENSTGRQRSRSASPRERQSSRIREVEEIRNQLLRETTRQVRKESKALEKAKQAVIKEITKGAYEMRANERRFNKRIPHAREERCERCIEEDIAREGNMRKNQNPPRRPTTASWIWKKNMQTSLKHS